MLTIDSTVQAHQQLGERLNKVAPTSHQNRSSAPLLDLRHARGLAINTWKIVDATMWIEQQRHAWD